MSYEIDEQTWLKYRRLFIQAGILDAKSDSFQHDFWDSVVKDFPTSNTPITKENFNEYLENIAAILQTHMQRKFDTDQAFADLSEQEANIVSAMAYIMIDNYKEEVIHKFELEGKLRDSNFC